MLLFYLGRKKKKGNKGGSSTNIHLSTASEGHGHYDGHSDSGSYEVVEYVSGGKKKGKKGKRKGGKKGQKGYKKYMKKMTPIALCILALKMLLQHFFLKKIALLSTLSFLLSKTSFILSSLLALKQMFHSGHQEKSDSGSKLEVVHIPIRKKHPDFHERDAEKNPNYIPLNEFSRYQHEATTPDYLSSFDNFQEQQNYESENHLNQLNTILQPNNEIDEWEHFQT